MLTIRTAETLIEKDFLENKIFSFYHSSKGQEAVAVGVCANLALFDRVYGNHRSHSHYIAKGGDLYAMFAEIYGKADGCCRGFGGSMHMLDREIGFMGSTPILGSVCPIALGSAFEQKFTMKPTITVCFFGDGASEEGVVYESINLAATMELPILFVLEDNLFAVNSPQRARRGKYFSYEKLCEGLDVKYVATDGNRLDYVSATTSYAIGTVRTHRPVVLHARTYRHMAHSGPIMDESVRAEDIKTVREAADPITYMETLLAGEQVKLNEVREIVQFKVNTAWKRAKDAPEPHNTKLDQLMYA